VQLPVYNERHVIGRLIEAAAALDYPRDRLEIQVLDDSTDETFSLAEEFAAGERAKGVNIMVIHRDQREGFKAGALAAGLRRTDAEFLAVFDADFCPHPDFLRRTIPALASSPLVGMVQTRWSHLNQAYSPLTRAEAIALDGHFAVEQTGRNRSGLLINFNGSGGVWRRQCIEEAGGWQSDTMTEDLDLSYRAQLIGWRAIYLPDVDAPAELPPQMEAYKRQQARWAMGSVQCLRKLTGPILRSRLSPVQKLMALTHISGYLAQPLMVLLLLLSLPMVLAAPSAHGRPLVWLGLAGVGPPILYLIGQHRLHPDWLRRYLVFPLLAVVTTGMTWSTSRGVWQGLTRWGGVFGRTPKFRIEGRRGKWAGSSYRLAPDASLIGEIALLAFAVVVVAFAIERGSYGAVPFLLLYVAGYATVAGSGLKQALARSRTSP
jgi:cellulose synthase/poly-beta-1,6-N-acetylglucosamine synthase-like glycosyltransferase